MTKNVVCVSPEQKIIDVKHIYEKDKFHHHIPVTKNGRLVDLAVNISRIHYNNKPYGAIFVRDIIIVAGALGYFLGEMNESTELLEPTLISKFNTVLQIALILFLLIMQIYMI